MELLPQSREALDEYVASVDDLEHELRVIEGWAVRTVPECVAMSVTFLDDDLTFTLVASPGPATSEVAEVSVVGVSVEMVDDVQLDAVETDTAEAALDEGWWAEMARSRASAGIASTVSLPVVDRGRVVLTIDLYASTAHAFHGRLDALAEALGASQAGAVTNADLGFESRRRAEEAPGRLRDQRVIDVAVGLLAARECVDVDAARALLFDSAQRAGIDMVQAALVVHAIHRG
ncbi:MAG: ANTAR domain-containing protein [Nocardioides sp.]|nr:ANTAR domain-containing protein [Nocardioides sp.]